MEILHNAINYNTSRIINEKRLCRFLLMQSLKANRTNQKVVKSHEDDLLISMLYADHRTYAEWGRRVGSTWSY